MNTHCKHLSQRKESLIIVLAIFFCCASNLEGQSIYDSRTMLLSARGAALARSYVSELSDVSCMAANPASLAFVKDSSIVINFYQELSNQMLSSNVIIPRKLGEQHTVGFGLSRYTYRHYQYGIDLAYSYRVSASFSAGILCQPRLGISNTSKLLSTTFGIGLFYFPVPGTRYGISILGLGNSLDLIPDLSSLIRTKQTKIVLGTSMNFPSWLKRPIMNLSASSESYLGEDYFRYSIGLELFPIEMLAARFGFLAGPSNDPQNDHGVSCGFGIRLGIWALDYGIGQSTFGKFHQISVRAQIEKII